MVEASYIYNDKRFTKSVFVRRPKYQKCEAHGFIYKYSIKDVARYNMRLPVLVYRAVDRWKQTHPLYGIDNASGYHR
jgi:hypothetical protein